MPQTYLNLNVHVIFATEGRRPTIDAGLRGDLHAYLGGTVRGLGAQTLAVGGTEDHVHLLLRLKATHTVADLVREIKKASSVWAATRHPGFRWQTGYAAFSVSQRGVPAVAAYVNGQEEHHRAQTSADELRDLLVEAGVEIDERYFE